MASAICIITSTGMKCLSSPLKEHRPGARHCVVAARDPARAARMARVRTALAARALGLSASRRGVIARVVELMLAANVDAGSRFVIVKAR